MTTQDEYAESLKRAIDDWNARIKKMRVDMEAESEKAQSHYREQLNELERLRDQAEAQMRDIQDSSRSQWNDNADKMKAAWREISDGFERAWSRLK